MNSERSLPFMPSTAEDAPTHAFGVLDLNSFIIKHPAATFFMRLGEKIAVVDRAVTPQTGSLAIVNNDGQLQAMRVTSKKPKEEVWGTVICLINKQP